MKTKTTIYSVIFCLDPDLDPDLQRRRMNTEQLTECQICGEESDALYCGGDGPLCWRCWGCHEKNTDQEVFPFIQ